jgi:hypothetical protein
VSDQFYNTGHEALTQVFSSSMPEFYWYKKPKRKILGIPKWPQKYQKVMKFTQMAIKYQMPKNTYLHQNFPSQGLPKFYNICIFWYENIPSGNPDFPDPIGLWLKMTKLPANPTILSYINANSSLVRFERKTIFFHFENRSSLQLRLRCSCVEIMVRVIQLITFIRRESNQH